MLSKSSKNRNPIHLIFITIQIILVSIATGCSLKVTEMQFVDNRGFPGGPEAWLRSFYQLTPVGFSNVFGVASFWMQDAFLVSINHHKLNSFMLNLSDLSFLYYIRVEMVSFDYSNSSIFDVSWYVD